MFDLAEHLRRWRHETELSLAFEPEEIDELEDHLKLAVEGAVRDGASPETAWREALARLGDSPPLAAEFAKSKLMPALFNLVRSWWQAGLLFVVFGFGLLTTYSLNGSAAAPSQGNPPLPFWIVTWVSFVALLALLPGKPAKSALLLGVGNAFCLLPLLHLAVYNALGNHLVGPGWNRMGTAFGWLPASLGIIGLIGLNLWAWKRCRPSPASFRSVLAAAGAIVLVLALSPFCSELIGNLSIRDIYSMPTAQDIPYTGDAQSQYLKWKFVDVLVDCVVAISFWLPVALALVSCAGVLFLHGIFRLLKVRKPADDGDFPAARDVPWIMFLATSGFSWIIATYLVPPCSANMRVSEVSVHHAVHGSFGFEFMVVGTALLFVVSAYELTRRVWRARCVRLFYASMMVVGEAIVLWGILDLPAVPEEPTWLSWLIVSAAVLLAAGQVAALAKKVRRGAVLPSLWKYEGSDLVRFGALLGLNFACSGLVLMMVALVLAFESTAMISAMIAWGNSVQHQDTHHFDPTFFPNDTTQMTYPTPHLTFWIYTGLTYAALCLAAGFAVAMALSGLEFIRFNGWRYYKLRKAERDRRTVLAVNE
jgi:hypothetical protein